MLVRSLPELRTGAAGAAVGVAAAVAAAVGVGVGTGTAEECLNGISAAGTTLLECSVVRAPGSVKVRTGGDSPRPVTN